MSNLLVVLFAVRDSSRQNISSQNLQINKEKALFFMTCNYMLSTATSEIMRHLRFDISYFMKAIEILRWKSSRFFYSRIHGSEKQNTVIFLLAAIRILNLIWSNSPTSHILCNLMKCDWLPLIQILTLKFSVIRQESDGFKNNNKKKCGRMLENFMTK